MTDHESWLANNNAYLATALSWLRVRLVQLAQTAVDHASPRTVPAQSVAGNGASHSWVGRLFGRQDAHTTGLAQAPLALPPGPAAEQAEALRRGAAELEQAADMQPPPALLLLAQRLGLTRFEQELLLLCAAMELDTRVASLCAQAQADPARPYPTYALALALSDQPSWDALSPHRPLRYWRLIEINQPGAQPLTTSALRADERIVSYLKGLNQLDDRVAMLLSLDGRLATGDLSLPPSQQAVADRLARRLGAVMPPPAVQLAGADSGSKRLIAARAAAALGLSLCVLPVDALPSHVGELETLARLWERESLLLPLALYLDAHDLMRGSDVTEGANTGLRRFLARSASVVFVDVRDALGGLGEREDLTVEIAKPEPAEQQRAWETALSHDARPMVADLVGQFNLGVPAIGRIAEDARAETGEDGGAFAPEVWRACLRFTRPRLEALAQHVAPKATLDTLVLPERERRKLSQIVEHVRWRSRVYNEFGLRETMNRGLGISVLFTGESGTGKTTAAEAIANALRLNLFRIDLSAVVSKYIGETEKNLRKVFDAAEDGGAILLFDEADALFGRRSEVKDSHDRYANIEIGYLLQRMEAYNGLAILTTNMKSALDQAFLRRLRFVVDFPFPGPAERKMIWQRAFPPRVALAADLDCERLARFNLSGGGIHNAAVHAAFLAAAQPGATVTMAMAVEAAQDELLRMNKPAQQV
jgi:AAA+ superfamily predicted ATPase